MHSPGQDDGGVTVPGSATFCTMLASWWIAAETLLGVMTRQATKAIQWALDGARRRDSFL